MWFRGVQRGVCAYAVFYCFQSKSSVPTPPASEASQPAPADETWRGGYATAASRRRMMSACAWGNGVRWNRPVGKVGRWTRIYPHTIPNDDEVRSSSLLLSAFASLLLYKELPHTIPQQMVLARLFTLSSSVLDLLRDPTLRRWVSSVERFLTSSSISSSLISLKKTAAGHLGRP